MNSRSYQYLTCALFLWHTVCSGESLDHKNDNLPAYLNYIQHNVNEKIGILPYILQNPYGRYLEIGTGGDAIAELMQQLPKSAQNLIIASDIEEDILTALPERHPVLLDYLHAQTGPQLRLIRLNAIDMSLFDHAFFDGINASALVHEIVSYAGGLQGVHTFFTEACRVLKPGGVLIYRDPEYMQNPDERVIVTLNTRSIRLFVHLFLPVFLDAHHTVRAQSGHKYLRYTHDDVLIQYYKKHLPNLEIMHYADYFLIPTNTIDFDRPHLLQIPCGLYREIARHYITYIYQCNPLMFVQPIPDIRYQHYQIHYLAHHAQSLLHAFLQEHHESLSDECASKKQLESMQQSMLATESVIEHGIRLRFSDQSRIQQLHALLLAHQFAPDRYVLNYSSHQLLLDYRIFALLYTPLKKNIFSQNNGPIDTTHEEHARWTQREGEEHYFYLSADALITRVLKQTQQTLFDGNAMHTFVLFPPSTRHSCFIERPCYSALLNKAVSVQTMSGHPIPIYDGKRIIHFAKMTVADAIITGKNMVAAEPQNYPLLADYLAMQ